MSLQILWVARPADAPTAAKQHLDKTLLLQPEKRLPHRRARDAKTHADFGFREAVAGHQAELGDVAFELCVNVIGTRTMDRHRGNDQLTQSGQQTHMCRDYAPAFRRAQPSLTLASCA